MMKNTLFPPPITAEPSRVLVKQQSPPESRDYKFRFLSCYCLHKNGALRYSGLFVPFCFGDIADCNGITRSPCPLGGLNDDHVC
jgi:hypothetical protein